MLERLRAGPGFRLAMAIAMFAALSFIAPPAVMAFGHGNNTVHCLSHGDVVGHGMLDSASHKDRGGTPRSPATRAAAGCTA